MEFTSHTRFTLASAFMGCWLISCTPTERVFNNTAGSSSSGSGGAGGSGDVGGAGGVGGAPAEPCPTETHLCAVPAPEGWSAPSAIVNGVPAPDCPAQYPTLAFDSHDDVAGAPATCGCSCGTPDVTCGDLVVFYRQSCGQPIGPDVASGPPNTCLIATPKQNAATAIFNEVGVCPPIPDTLLEPPTFQSSHRSCTADKVDAVCENGLTCTPQVFPPFQLCVTRDGDLPCPPGYPERALHFKGTADSRGCTECTCGSAKGARCESSLQAYADELCGTPVINGTLTSGNEWNDSPCIGSFSNYIYTTPKLIEPGSCLPSLVDPMGTIDLAEPVTFCCAKN